MATSGNAWLTDPSGLFTVFEPRVRHQAGMLPLLYPRYLPFVLLAINWSVVHLHSESDTLLLASISNSNQTVKTRQGWFFDYNAYVKTPESRPRQWTGWWFIFDQPCLVLEVDHSLFSPCFHSTGTILRPPPVQELPLFLAISVRWGAGRSGRCRFWPKENATAHLFIYFFFAFSGHVATISKWSLSSQPWNTSSFSTKAWMLQAPWRQWEV